MLFFLFTCTMSHEASLSINQISRDSTEFELFPTIYSWEYKHNKGKTLIFKILVINKGKAVSEYILKPNKIKGDFTYACLSLSDLFLQGSGKSGWFDYSFEEAEEKSVFQPNKEVVIFRYQLNGKIRSARFIFNTSEKLFSRAGDHFKLSKNGSLVISHYLFGDPQQFKNIKSGGSFENFFNNTTATTKGLIIVAFLK